MEMLLLLLLLLLLMTMATLGRVKSVVSVFGLLQTVHDRLEPAVVFRMVPSWTTSPVVILVLYQIVGS